MMEQGTFFFLNFLFQGEDIYIYIYIYIESILHSLIIVDGLTGM